MNKTNNYSPKVAERTVRRVLEARKDQPSLWAAAESIGPKIGGSAVTLHARVRKHNVDTGIREGFQSGKLSRLLSLITGGGQRFRRSRRPTG